MVNSFYKFIQFYKFFFDISGLFSVIPGFSIPAFNFQHSAFSTTPRQHHVLVKIRGIQW